MKHLYFGLAAMIAYSLPASAAELTVVKSPDGQSTLCIMDDQGTLSYRLERADGVVIDNSTLGIVTSVADFSSGLKIENFSSKEINEKFKVLSGNREEVSDVCQEITVDVSKDNHTASFLVRLYNEGVAWKYILNGDGEYTILEETGVCHIPNQQSTLSFPLSQGVRSSFVEREPAFLQCMGKTATPLVVNSHTGNSMLFETALSGNYCGSRITVTNDGGYIFSPIETIKVHAPLETPWRVVLAASPSVIAESSIAQCLAKPTSVSDISWIQPGFAVSAFCGEDHASSYLDINTVKEYIDWAYSQGWKYFILDRNWQQNGLSLNEVSQYAKSKNIGIIAWLNRHSLPSSGTELGKLLSQLKSQGAAGIKVDFWENETQATLKQRDELLEICAQLHLVVTLSNVTNVAGLNRTWPNLLASESRLNNSVSGYSSQFMNASHNINFAIFQAYAGPIDHYPMDIALADGKLLQQTTHAHQLAQTVAFPSGMMTISDSPYNLKYNLSRGILKRLPSEWNESQCIKAIENQLYIVMRRSGEECFISVMANDARKVELPLDFLKSGEIVSAEIYKDGICPSDIAFDYKEGLSSTSTLTFDVAAGGGALIRLNSGSDNYLPFGLTLEAETNMSAINAGAIVTDDSDDLCSGSKFLSEIGAGCPLEFKGITVPETGKYAVTVYYMSTESSDGFIRLNGALSSVRQLSFINTGSMSGRNLAQTTALVDFNKTNDNTLEINSGSNLPAIDRIVITSADAKSMESGLSEINVDPSVRIYTANGGVIIESSPGSSYSVCDLLGRVIASGKTNNSQIFIPVNVHNLVLVTVGNGESKTVKKLIIR